MCSRHASLETKRAAVDPRRSSHECGWAADRPTGGQPEKGVMPVRHDLGLSDGHAFAGDREPGPAQVGAMQQSMGEGKPIHQFGGSTLSMHGALAASAAEQGGSAPSTPCAIARGRSGAGQQQRSKSKQPVEGLHGVTFAGSG